MFGWLTRQASSKRAAKPWGSGGTQSAPSFKPYGLAGQPWEYAAAAVFTLALLLVFLVDTRTKASSEITAIDLIAVIAAAWLLSAPLALWIVGLSVGLVAADAVSGDLRPVTAAVEAAVFAVLAVAVRFYAAKLRSVLEGADGEEAAVVASVFGLENLANLVECSGEGVLAIDTDGRVRYANSAATELLGLSERPGPRQNLFDRVASEDRERLRSDLDVSGTRSAGHLNFGVRGAGPSVRRVQASHTRVMVGRLPFTALVLRDVSQVNRLHHAAGALAETAASQAVTEPLEQTLAAVARRVVEVTEACACAVFLLESERSLRLAGSYGLPEGYEAAANRAAKAGANLPVFEAIRTGSPVFVENLPERIRVEPQFAGMRTVARNVAWRLAIAFPMVNTGRPLGGLAVYFLPGQRPDEATMDFLSTIAGQAASAAEISRLVTAGQDQVAVNERHRLSRELHDSLSQRLYGIILGAKSVEMRLAGHGEQAAESVAYVLELAQGGLAEMRDIILQLRPESLEKDGLIVALSLHVDAINARHQFNVIKSLPAEPDLPLETKLAAYRIVLEALNNVAKHANAERAWLRVEHQGGRLAIEVRDDGEGFDPDGCHPGHYGLETMRERTTARGGELEIQSRPGAGTTVRAWLPSGDTAATSSPMGKA